VRVIPISVCLALGFACARVQSSAAPIVEGEVRVADFGETLFFPGEAVVWDVRWFDVVMGGMSLAVGQPGEVEGQPALIVRIEVHTAGVLAAIKKVRGEVATMLDLGSGIPMKVAGSIDDLYSGDVMKADYKPKAVSLDWRTWAAKTPSGAPITELAGTVGWLRGWDGGKGEKAHFFARFRGRIYRVDAVARGTELLEQGGARVRARRVDGILTRMTHDMRPNLSDYTYPFIGWATDDDQRIPLRIHVQAPRGGVIALEMTAYQRGVTSVTTR